MMRMRCANISPTHWSSVLRPVFSRNQQICYAYNLLSFLDLKICQFCVHDDNNDDDSTTNCFTRCWVIIKSIALVIIMNVLLHITLFPQIPLWQWIMSLKYWTRYQETSGRMWWVEDLDLIFPGHSGRRSREDTPLTQRRTMQLLITMWTVIHRRNGEILLRHYIMRGRSY